MKMLLDSDEWDRNKDFWALLPGDIDQITEESVVKDHEFERSFKSSEITLYKYEQHSQFLYTICSF